MKIVHISDTHGFHNAIVDMPDGDIIVHSGDFTMAGSDKEVIDFVRWFLSLPYRHKVFVAGNHDKCLCTGKLKSLPSNCHYLDNSRVEIEGLLFYGLPMFTIECMSGQHEININKIPYNIDVLITHQPPYKIMDYDGRRRYGSKTLLSKVNDIKPRFHLFGHIHSGYGTASNGITEFYNSALVSDQYILCNKPQIITL